MIKNILNRFVGKGNDEETFLKPFTSPDYQQINVARLAHLNGLGLSLDNKSVVEFGAGIGDHTYFYLTRNCQVVATDGRKDLVDYIAKRFQIVTKQINAESDLALINTLPSFEIVHCYGLLYHINNPLDFLTAISKKGDLLLLETCVSPDGYDDSAHLEDEDRYNPTQAISGQGCRPTRNWIFNQLRALYPFVYMPITQPKHHQFPTNWNNVNDAAGYIRAVFIASKSLINSPSLSSEFVKNYKV